MPGPPGFWRQQQLLPWAADPDPDTASTTPAAVEPSHKHRWTRRDLADGTVAGVAVGVVIFSLLLALCLYPVIVGCLKRRKGDRRLGRHPLDLDDEGAIGHDAGDGPRPRISSSDSLKHANTLSRGYDFDPAAAGADDDEAEPQQDGVPNPDRVLLDFGRYDPKTARGTVEYMPKEMVIDDQPGVLKGTSEDYYRASIPSSAFGMPDEPFSLPPRTTSRASSLSHNVRHMFRRKSDRNPTFSSVGSSSGDGADQGATPLQRIITAEEPMAESPTELSPRASPQPRSPAVGIPPSVTPRGPSAEPPDAALSSTSSPRTLLKSPSPPVNPAPGTVNPMDIMAPSTESEQWHRTEYQLYASSNETPPPQPLQPPAESEKPSDSTNQTSSPDVQMGSAHQNMPDNKRFEQNQAVAGEDSHLQADNIKPVGRHPSFPSEHSTPLPGPGFTDASSQNTPSTQLDTPSPESQNSSDFRHSASPGVVAHHMPSPVKNQDGMYQCDEPGCTQSFDQPHKLKHHQRYHSKDHKCPYPACGKGFGTKTHLQRHINDRHEKKKKFHCSMEGCDYSKFGGRAFPRKDNWKRHMMKIHNLEQQQLPLPVEVDAEMTGV
ncbi:Zinc finger domain-containing protein, C2H2-type [Cordyceps fumosorosea ARSEF 2679]|uniref:Zinc finger domain-containing protein, C2H2-type n=1 Tax=Cordyceps fumosorosea (strain ARSEF 2679) TaxID=1081104 RepID=A0A167NK43_CORFA|nr:Zinc finger domain-containing protein, C2H2-type [Cordyceps fumosorosea ARSEF 2679]OAA55636.1 Zinc finger domain-containing protein, C2H2-type [Cordyceps fumosorosea ARSEF 2679]